jgi:outer membrane immunogenic protein
MKKLILASASLLVLAAAQPAASADLKAPVFVDPWSWSGGYIGANMGYSWGRSNTTMNVSNSTTGALLFPGDASLQMNDVIGGGQIGANWQSGIWVVGVEADIQTTAERGRTTTACTAGACNTSGALPGAARIASATFEQRMTWFGTARGRLGYTPTQPILAYVTGGLAYGHLEELGSVTGFTATGGATTAAISGAQTKVGWTVGAGVEGRINAAWTVKLEYLYVDLGSVSTTATLPANAPPLTTTFNSRFTDNIVRVGVNYKFDYAGGLLRAY